MRTLIIKGVLPFWISLFMLLFLPHTFANRTPKVKQQSHKKYKQHPKSDTTYKLYKKRQSKTKHQVFNIAIFLPFISLILSLGLFAFGLLITFPFVWIIGLSLTFIALTLFWAATAIVFFPKEWLPWHLIFIFVFGAALVVGLILGLFPLWLIGAIMLGWILVLYIIGFSFAQKLRKNAGKE